MDGWISLHRKITEHPDYFSEKFTRMSAWIDLLLLANHKTGYIRVRGVKVEVNRGQTAVSSERLAERWKWSRGKVTRFLNELEKEGQIVQQKNNIINCITIVNYNLYQSNNTANETTESTTKDTSNETAEETTNSTSFKTTDSTPKGQQTIQQTDINNNNNKNNNQNNNTYTDNFFDDKILTRARKFVEWLQTDVPTVQQMREPLTVEQAAKIISKHPEGDAKRIFLTIHNKGATSCKSAFATYCNFSANDKVLKERYELKTKYYTYNQVSVMVTQGKADMNDFEKIQVEGQTLWRYKVDRINAQRLLTQSGQ